VRLAAEFRLKQLEGGSARRGNRRGRFRASGAGTCQFQYAATSKTISDRRNPACVTFRPTLKCLKARKKPATESRSIIKKWRDNCLRQLRRARADSGSEQIYNEH